MRYAVYKENNKEIRVDAMNFFRHPDFHVVKHKLICYTEGCNCKVAFVNCIPPRRSHFKKHVKSDHIESCQYFKESINNERVIEKIVKVLGNFPPSEINNRLKHGFKKYLEPEDDSLNNRKTQQNKKLVRKGEQTKSTRIVQQGIINFELGRITFDKKEVRLPYVRHKDMNMISEKDIGKPLFIYGYLENIRKLDKELFELDLIFEGKKLTLFLQEAYFKSILIQGVEDSLIGLQNYISKGHEVLVGSLGILEKSKDKFLSNITDYNSLYVQDVQKIHMPHLPVLSFMAAVSRSNL
nr:hypothetical protein [Mammaliicoccus sp. Marseille-Q6498]